MSFTKSRSITVAFFALVASLVSSPIWAQMSKYQEGVHYFKIDQASTEAPDGSIQLMEAFSYMCSHCNTFEPYIADWLTRKPEHVKFVRVPVIFGRQTWELYARAYVTAELMGVANDAHPSMMDALWKEKKIMRSMEEIGDFYSAFGVSASDFLATSKSFAVDARMRKDQRLTQTYGVNGTPTLIVNGKYLIRGSKAVPNYDVMLDVVDTLIAQETAAAAVKQQAEAETEPGAENG